MKQSYFWTKHLTLSKQIISLSGQVIVSNEVSWTILVWDVRIIFPDERINLFRTFLFFERMLGGVEITLSQNTCPNFRGFGGSRICMKKCSKRAHKILEHRSLGLALGWFVRFGGWLVRAPIYCWISDGQKIGNESAKTHFQFEADRSRIGVRRRRGRGAGWVFCVGGEGFDTPPGPCHKEPECA